MLLSFPFNRVPRIIFPAPSVAFLLPRFRAAALCDSFERGILAIRLCIVSKVTLKQSSAANGRSQETCSGDGVAFAKWITKQADQRQALLPNGQQTTITESQVGIGSTTIGEKSAGPGLLCAKRALVKSNQNFLC